MGIPSFYRWLSRKYRGAIKNCVLNDRLPPPGEERANLHDQVEEENPQGIDIDNLYLDMNGLIHPCSHPVGGPQPQSNEDIFQSLFYFIDHMVWITRPRKLLYLAVDGVAPRAKINQQRSRRFLAARNRARAKMAEGGEENGEEVMRMVEKEEEEKFAFDSNCITPGTEFMEMVTRAIKYHVAKQLNENPLWKHLEVVLSDSNAPGEGEHKIMNYIRHMRVQKGYNPETSHCVCGLDADLIMLALASHEPNFYILREKFFFKQSKPNGDKPLGPFNPRSAAHQHFEFVYISELRGLLLKEFFVLRHSLWFGFDLERILDDFVFVCFFVGNDFLPHLPCFTIYEGAIDRLIMLYKTQLPKLGGYLTENGTLHLGRLEVFMNELTGVEDEIIESQKKKDQKRKRKAGIRNTNSEFTQGLNARDTQKEEQKEEEDEGKGRTKENATHIAPEKRAEDHLILIECETKEGEKEEKEGEGEEEKEEKGGEKGGEDGDVKMGEEKEEEEVGKLLVKKRKKKRRGKPKVGGGVVKEKEEEKNEVTEEGQGDVEMDNSSSSTSSSSTSNPSPSPSIPTTSPSTGTPVSSLSSSSSLSSVIPIKDLSIAPSSSPSPSPSPFPSKENEEQKGNKEKEKEEDEEEDEHFFDPEYGVEFGSFMGVRIPLGEEMFFWDSTKKESYYLRKFGLSTTSGLPEEVAQARHRIALEYLRGLMWVLSYYYQGCCSWNWYYPFHYAPYASDLVYFAEMSTSFDKGTPFSPFMQLLSVLPSASSRFLPPPYRWLMTRDDSPIADFYPIDFDIDMEGKRFEWQGVTLLPFIDESRLKNAIHGVDKKLTEGDRDRNSRHDDLLFVAGKHPLIRVVSEFYEDDIDFEMSVDIQTAHKIKNSDRKTRLACVGGLIVSSPKNIRVSPGSEVQIETNTPEATNIIFPPNPNPSVYNCLYQLPILPPGFVFPSKLLSPLYKKGGKGKEKGKEKGKRGREDEKQHGRETKKVKRDDGGRGRRGRGRGRGWR